MKYIIELEKIEGTNLYKAKGFNTLVFDNIGIGKLTEYYENEYTFPIQSLDVFKAKNGKKLYRFIEHIKNETHDFWNCVDIENGKFVATPAKKEHEIIIVDRGCVEYPCPF